MQNVQYKNEEQQLNFKNENGEKLKYSENLKKILMWNMKYLFLAFNKIHMT